jgi:hypothetical protein
MQRLIYCSAQTTGPLAGKSTSMPLYEAHVNLSHQQETRCCLQAYTLA